MGVYLKVGVESLAMIGQAAYKTAPSVYSFISCYFLDLYLCGVRVPVSCKASGLE